MTKKQLKKYLLPHLSKKVAVTYGDNKGNHETTVEQLYEKWFGETVAWKEHWFGQLLNNGIAHSNYGGTYKIISQ